MKKLLALSLASLMCLSVLVGCSGGAGSSEVSTGSESTAPSEASSEATGGVELRVVSSFSGTDGNRPTFEAAYTQWETDTGNTVVDESQTSDEAWKAKVIADFETGADPDVLFFFNGNDSNSFVEAGKVVSIDDIRAEYPDYASNMQDAMIPVSPVDGKAYAVPTSGYWEGLYVNKTVLADAGVDMPTATTTWDEFLTMCQTIKDAGYTPIAVSLQQVPHYWFEFCIMNNGGPANHLQVPQAQTDGATQAWAAGLNDIKDLYQRGFFPENTLSASDEETFQLMYDNEAAFAIDGSWKRGQILENVGDERIGEYTCTYVPAREARKPTDIIGGLSMGWYITKKAWDDPEKRDAAISFIEALTTDDVVNAMAVGGAVTALKSPAGAPADVNALDADCYAMIGGATSVVPAVQDYISPEAKDQILTVDTKLVASGEEDAETAVANMAAINNTTAAPADEAVAEDQAKAVGDEAESGGAAESEAASSSEAA